MRPLLKMLHIAAVVGYAGTLAAVLAIGATADDGSPSAYAAVRQAVAVAATNLAVPSLVLLVVTGALLVVRQPAFFEARWVWAKAALGVLLAIVALGVVQPAITRAAALARIAADGVPVLEALSRALTAEWIGGLLALGLSLLAVALAIWRPRLGAARDH